MCRKIKETICIVIKFKVMKKMVFVFLAAFVFAACEQKETEILPTFKERVEFEVNSPDFHLADYIEAENIQEYLQKEVTDPEAIGSVSLTDIWLEVNPYQGNVANMAYFDVYIKTGEGDEALLLFNDMVVPVKDEKSVVPLISLVESKGAGELERQLSNIVSGKANKNIELVLKGETFSKGSLDGNVNVELELFIRYGF